MVNKIKYTAHHILILSIILPVFGYFMPKALIDFGYSQNEIGLILSFIGMGTILPSLYFSIKKLTKKTIYISLFLVTLSLICFYIFSVSWLEAAILLFIWKFCLTVSQGVFEQMSYDEESAFYNTMKGIGTFGFIPVLFFLTDNYSKDLVVYILMFGSVLLFIIDTNILYKKPEFEVSKSKIKFKMISKNIFFIFEIISQVGAISIIFGFGINYFIDNNFTMQEIFWFYLAMVIAEGYMFFFIPKSLKKKSPDFIVNISVLLTSLRMLILYLFIDSFILILLAQLLHSFSLSTWHLAKMQKIQQKFQEDGTQLGQQIYMSSWGIGLSLGGLIGGTFYSKELFLGVSIYLFIVFIIKTILEKTHPNLI